jgi:REP element-mobilizing transposase RayT
MQFLSSTGTTWHITFGTYGARLHGSDRPTVSRAQNNPGDPFIEPNRELAEKRRSAMTFQEVRLTREQQLLIENVLPEIVNRGGWTLRTCAAGPDHVHILLDIDPRVHGEKVRRLLKRWLGLALSQRWPRPEGASWWAEQGSNIAIHEEDYLTNAFDYVFEQRAHVLARASAGAGDGPARD